MTVMDNILNNLRRFFGMEETATAAEIDDRLEDYVAPPQESAPAVENEGAENRVEESAPAPEPVQANLEPLLAQIQSLQSELAALKAKAAAKPAEYEETAAETGDDPRERYFCSTTLRAMGRM